MTDKRVTNTNLSRKLNSDQWIVCRLSVERLRYKLQESLIMEGQPHFLSYLMEFNQVSSVNNTKEKSCDSGRKKGKRSILKDIS